ncbi:MAG: hypothetical protein ACOC00_07170 [Halothiobacillaceae bacterium]
MNNPNGKPETTGYGPGPEGNPTGPGVGHGAMGGFGQGEAGPGPHAQGPGFHGAQGHAGPQPQGPGVPPQFQGAPWGWGMAPGPYMPQMGYPWGVHPAAMMQPGMPFMPPNFGGAAGMQPPPAPEQAGFQAAFDQVAEQNGLGMLKGFFDTQDSDFWKGALVGAAAVMLLTNDHLRDSLIGGAAKTAGAVKSSFGLGANDPQDSEAAEQAPEVDEQHEESRS